MIKTNFFNKLCKGDVLYEVVKKNGVTFKNRWLIKEDIKIKDCQAFILHEIKGSKETGQKDIISKEILTNDSNEWEISTMICKENV